VESDSVDALAISGAASILLLIMACIASTAVARLRLASKVPDIIVFILIGILFGKSGAHSVFIGSGTGFQAGGSLLPLLQFVSLFMLMFTSCASLQPGGFRRSVTEIGVLICGTGLAFVLAVATVPYLAALTVDPFVLSLGQNANRAYELTLALGVVVTSVPFLKKIFINVKLLKTNFASTILFSACVVDLLVWAIFSVALLVRSGEHGDAHGAGFGLVSVMASALMIALAGLATARLYRHVRDSHAPLRHMDLLAIGAVSSGIIYLSALTGGGTLIGMVISGLVFGSIRQAVRPSLERLEQLSTHVAIPAYFTCVGYGIDLHSDYNITFIFLFLVWSSVLKIGSVWTIFFLFSRSAHMALDYAIAMNTRGGPGLVLAAAALSAGIIGISTFLALVAASILTSVVTESYLATAAAKKAPSRDMAFPERAPGPRAEAVKRLR
jgi:Kef-type K+ transport system membrane component KefB